MTDRQIISTPDAPHALASYSQAVRVGDTIFTSGQIGLDPATGEMVPGGVEEQTRRILDNIRTVLEASGSGLDRVVKATCFLADIADFAAFNDVYAAYFPADPPARSTFAVAGLPRGARVEIETVAVVRRPGTG
jgi:2-iminobutanoate/2-iminopropanoate deaminase